ncbi:MULTISPECIES: RDD family protein [unclassified Dyella]|uniref:RDD family protein n=1 Tax=unclassified Dyella TaxID=2634549 RepID=UPI003F913028
MSQGNAVGDLAIAGFWRRAGAFLFDVIVLGLIGMLVGALLFDPLARAGGYALIPGFAMALLYFGIGNSHVMGGQTLGKMVAGVRVVDKDGDLLALPRSVMRYAVLGTPYFLACIPFAATPFHPLTYAIGAIAGFGELAIIYLFVFNRRTRQSLHDLVVATYVVRATREDGQPRFATMWQGHWAFVGLLAALALAVPFIGPRFLSDDLKAMVPVQNAMLAQPHVRAATLSQMAVSFNGHAPVHSIVATIQLDESLVERADMARSFADIIAASHLDLSGDDSVRVSLNYGYSMGIAHGTVMHSYIYRPGELVLAAEGGTSAPAGTH